MNSIKWLCDEIELEVKDRNEEPENEWEDRSLVSSALEISKSIEKHDFSILLKSAGFRYPDHEHVYWRIGKNLSVNELEFFRYCHEDRSVYHLQAGTGPRYGLDSCIVVR